MNNGCYAMSQIRNVGYAPITDKILQASAFFLNALPNAPTLLALFKEMTFNHLLAFDPEI